MGKGFHVDLARLATHQTAVDALHERAAIVAGAGSEVTPAGWDNAYGLMFQVFPTTTAPIAHQLIAFIAAAVRGLEVTAQGLDATAAGYQASDGRTHAGVRDLDGRLRGTP